MGKKDSKHKKKSHKKKDKKERRDHKEKKLKRCRESSSTSDSDASTDYRIHGSEEPKSSKETKRFAGDVNNQVAQDQMDELFSEKYTLSRKKKEPRKEGCFLQKPEQSERELNPYWKDGGNGLPPVEKEATLKFERTYDIKSLKVLLQKARDTADVTGIPLAEIIKQEWGPLEKLKQLIQDSERQELEKKDKFSSFQRYLYTPKQLNVQVTEGNNGKLNFMKPGEGSGTDFVNLHKRNWRKKDNKELSVMESALNQNQNVKETVFNKHKTLLTSDELNALAAKKIKAEIMGNRALAEKIEREIEAAKKNRQVDLDAKNSKEEVIVVDKNILDVIKKQEITSHKRRGETHVENKRLRYFMDDDKHSLKSMFEKEKHGSTEHPDELFFKLTKKEKCLFDSGGDDLEDEFLDRVRRKSYETLENDKERSRIISEEKEKQKSLSHCRWCLDGNKVQKHLIVSIGSKCYLCLPSEKSLTNGHCLIIPTYHATCGTTLDEDVWNEIHSYRNRLCRMFEDADQDVVFFENARSFNRFPHMVLQCVPLDKEVGELAPIYFKKAIMESETEWSHNKKLIDLRKKDLRRGVPKGLPYFSIDFGRDGGFAHVIEDETLFPSTFAEEIIGGMLDLDITNWRNRRRENLEAQKEKVKEFIKRWKKYEDPESKPNLDSSDSD